MTTRARDLGIRFDGSCGKYNSITDVAGVEVGLVTLIEDRHDENGKLSAVRTGVTAILPRGKQGVGKPCVAATHSLNGNGEMTGRTWIEESGTLSTPILLTNTHSVGAVHSGCISWMAKNSPEAMVQWVLPVVAETWDGYLNDINAQHITPLDAETAIESAKGGAIAEGNVGGGTGMNAYGFKGGTGTASRKITLGSEQFTVGVLVQANHGSRKELSVAGVKLGSNSKSPSPIEETNWLEDDRQKSKVPPGAGSIIVVVATDAPLLPNQIGAMVRRVPLGIARTGTSGSHFSGDIFVGFSTANPDQVDSIFPSQDFDASKFQSLKFIPWGYMDSLFEGVVQAVEEAILNALVAATDLEGRAGHKSFAIPHSEIIEAFQP